MGLLNFKDMATNPLLQMGLGILGNNTGHYGQFMPAVSRGGLQGLQNVQQFQQQDQFNDFRKQQMQRYERQNQQDDAIEASHNEFDQKFPQYKGLSRINSAAAAKVAYPNATANTVDPYFKDVYIGGKVYAFDARTGEYIPKDLGGSGLPNKDDPKVQFPVAAAKSAGDNLYNVTDQKDGFLMPMTNLAIESGAPSLDYLSPNAAPSAPSASPSVPTPQGNPWQIPPELQAQRDDKARQLIASEGGNNLGITPPAPFNLSRGIPVPTKAEEAAAVQSAKDNAEFNSPDATKKRSMANQFKKTTAQNVINSIDIVKDKVDGWSAGTGGNIMRALPFNNDAKDIAADLETVKSNFGFDRLQTMRDMSPTGGALGQVAVQELTALQASVANLNPEVQSPEQLKRNLEKAKTHYKNWLDTLTKEDINNTGGGASGSFDYETNGKGSSISSGGWSVKKVK